jgi:hypothetical protein
MLHCGNIARQRFSSYENAMAVQCTTLLTVSSGC